MNRKRKKKYLKLREIRRERDYHSGKLQYANRPMTFPSLRTVFVNGVWKPKFKTTNEFIKEKGLR